MHIKEQKKAVKNIVNSYKALPKDVQVEVFKLISELKQNEIEADEFTDLSTDSFSSVWNTPENEHWDQFMKQYTDV